MVVVQTIVGTLQQQDKEGLRVVRVAYRKYPPCDITELASNVLSFNPASLQENNELLGRNTAPSSTSTKASAATQTYTEKTERYLFRLNLYREKAG